MSSVNNTPRTGKTIRALIIARISTELQDERSLDDQEALCRKHLEQLYTGPIVTEVIATQGSGERLDRPELEAITARVESGEIDVVIAEDLGRIMRRMAVFGFLELCEDAGIRAIAINDRIDTNDDVWRQIAPLMAMHHERNQEDISRRLRRTFDNRFATGSLHPRCPFGYRRVKGGRIEVVEQHRPIVREIFERIADGQSFAEIARWLNSQGVETGPYAGRTTWDGTAVSRMLKWDIYTGKLSWGKVRNKRVNRTGRRVAVSADPATVIHREDPSLRIVEPELLNKARLAASERVAGLGRPRGLTHQRDRVHPERRSYFPSRHMICGHCGRPMVLCGFEEDKALLCSGRRGYECWNSVHATAPVVARRLVQALSGVVLSVEEHKESLAEMVRERLEVLRNTTPARIAELERQHAKKLKSRESIDSAIEKAEGDISGLITRRNAVHKEIERIEDELNELRRQAPVDRIVPTIERVLETARTVIDTEDLGTPEMYRLLSRIFPRIYAYTFRPILGGKWVCRLRAEVNLGALAGDTRIGPLLGEASRRVIVVDGFDPPVWLQRLPRVEEALKAGIKIAEIADELETSNSRVLHLKQLLKVLRDRGTTDPFEPLTEPPPDHGRHVAHLNPAYRFTPAPGHVPWDGSWPQTGHI